MRIIGIKNQAEYDSLPDSFADYTIIKVVGNISANRSRENSHVEARENSHVEACGNSHVEAWGNSRVEAWGNSHVEACGNSHVEAWGNSHVVARENSHVVARGNSRVVAWGSVSVGVFSPDSQILLYGFAVAIIAKTIKAAIQKKSKSAHIQLVGELDWFENNAVEKKKHVILFKRVSKDYLTQEGEKWETKWGIGEVLDHPCWEPESQECGPGKFHACSRPYFCDEFRNTPGDRYIAIKIFHKDLYPWPNPRYPHKIGFRKGRVLYECDRYGEKIGK